MPLPFGSALVLTEPSLEWMNHSFDSVARSGMTLKYLDSLKNPEVIPHAARDSQIIIIVTTNDFELERAKLIVQKLKTSDESANIPTFFILGPTLKISTQTVKQSVEMEIVNSGADGFLWYPFDAATLVANIFLLIKNSKKWNDMSALNLRTHQLSECETLSANKALEVFSYSISHDLRAPLRAIEGFGQALEKGYSQKLDDRARDFLSEILRGSHKMGEMIDSLIKLSTIGRNGINLKKINLSTLVLDSIQYLQSLALDRKVKIRVEPNVEVIADPLLMRNAIDQLITNAWKFTAKTEYPSIEFGIERKGDGSPPVYFVKDNGIGFEMQHTKKQFGTFQRLHAEDEYPGLGIGLATVKKIVELHGGKVWSNAELGKGATFYFTLGPLNAGEGNLL